jgi:Protein of unknown function (DUF559)
MADRVGDDRVTWFTAGVPDALRRMADTATGQHGAITVEQIGVAGMSPDQLRRRVQSGILDQILPHTFRSPFSATSPRAELAALVLDCGPESFASGPSAAALHRLDGFVLKAPFHVTVLRGRNVQRAHHFIHTTTELPLVDRTTVEGIAAMSATRTMIDVARFVRPDRLTAALDAALRDGLTSEEALHERITQLRSSGRYGIPQLLAVIEGSEITRGGHSWLERRFLELCGRAMLPRPDTQQVLTRTGDRLVRVDCRFPGTRVVVELLGYRWHRTKAQMSRDAERQNALILDGFLPIQFTYDQVTLDPDGTIDTVRRTLATP